MPLILASRSPRRKQLLAEAGLSFEVLLPDESAEDERLPDEPPEKYVCRLARQKAENAARKRENGIFLGCDTVVLCNENILEKPADRNDARKMLRMLRGQVHTVLSGICLFKEEKGRETVILSETAASQLLMQPVSDEMLESYLDTGYWAGKAGAFGYQDGNDWLTILEGSESNVVGLPMECLVQMLNRIEDK